MIVKHKTAWTKYVPSFLCKGYGSGRGTGKDKEVTCKRCLKILSKLNPSKEQPNEV